MSSSDDEAPWWRPRDEDTNAVIEVEQSVQEATDTIEDGTQQVLDLSFRCIGVSGLREFSKKLNLNKSLTKIDLSCNMLEDEGATLFFGAIAKLTSIAKVNFAGNMVGPAGGIAFANCIRVNKTLEKVSFFHNEIGDEGAKAIAEALRVNRTLHSLNLRENRITDDGASELLESVSRENNTSLLVLWLKNNVAQPKPGSDLVELLPDSLRGKLGLLSQEEGLYYNHISAEMHANLHRILVEKTAALPEGDPRLKKSDHGGKKSKHQNDDPGFWTPPQSPEPPEVDEVEKEAKKKKKR